MVSVCRSMPLLTVLLVLLPIVLVGDCCGLALPFPRWPSLLLFFVLGRSMFLNCQPVRWSLSDIFPADTHAQCTFCTSLGEIQSAGGGPAEMSGRWLIPAAGYYGVPTGKNGVAKMASLRLRIGAQITRRYAHNLLINVYTLNFYGKQH